MGPRGTWLPALVVGVGRIWVLSALLMLGSAATVGAELSKGSDDGLIVVTKQVDGKVSAISPRLSFINVIYKSDAEKGVEYEMPLVIGKDVELRHVRSLSEIGFGDLVSVKYDEKQRTVTQQGKDGSLRDETQVVSREAKLITFLRPVKKGLMSGN